MKKILIIGSNGLLGQKAVSVFKPTYKVYTAGIESAPVIDHGLPYDCLDITRAEDVKKIITRIEPDILLNAAAYTQVDKAEEERELCHAVNVNGVQFLGEACKQVNTRMIHISTDYVFDGKKGNYCETDSANPLGYYGQSKLDGEKALQDSGCSFLICRTAVLFGYGVQIQVNFALWVLDQLRAEKPIRVVDDQIGNPTIADNLADVLEILMVRDAQGIYHVAGSEAISRYHFAVAVADHFNLDKKRITRITSDEFPQQAPRPMDASLDVTRVQKEHHVKLYNVSESLTRLEESMHK